MIREEFKLHSLAVMKRRPATPGPSNGPVQSTRPNRAVWLHALQLAGGDPHRIEVLSTEAVVVHNGRGWRG